MRARKHTSYESSSMHNIMHKVCILLLASMHTISMLCIQSTSSYYIHIRRIILRTSSEGKK